MAIDTQDKRRSALGLWSTCRILPVPAAGIPVADRYHVYLYRGLSGGGPPAYIFKAQVVPIYVHPDPTAAGVVPMYFTSLVPGVTRVHTIPLAFIEAGCVPMRNAGGVGVGHVPVIEEA